MVTLGPDSSNLAEGGTQEQRGWKEGTEESKRRLVPAASGGMGWIEGFLLRLYLGACQYCLSFPLFGLFQESLPRTTLSLKRKNILPSGAKKLILTFVDIIFDINRSLGNAVIQFTRQNVLFIVIPPPLHSAGFPLQDHEAITGLLGIINQYCHTLTDLNFTLYFHFNRRPAAEHAVRNAKAGETPVWNR